MGDSQLQGEAAILAKARVPPNDPEKPNEGGSGQADTGEASACPDPGGSSWERDASMRLAPACVPELLPEKSGRWVLKTTRRFWESYFFPGSNCHQDWNRFF